MQGKDVCGLCVQALGLDLGFEPLLLPFTSSDRQMQILNAVITSKPAKAMKMPKPSKSSAARKAEVQPYGMTAHLRWKSVPLKR